MTKYICHNLLFVTMTKLVRYVTTRKSEKSLRRYFTPESTWCQLSLIKSRLQNQKRYNRYLDVISNLIYMFSKMCTRCRIVKSFDHFSPAKRLRDGMACHCKECHQIDCRESRRRQKEERIVEQEIYENNIHNLEVDLIVLMMWLALVVVVSIILMAILWGQ